MGYSFDDLTVLRFDSRSTLYTKVDSKADKSKKRQFLLLLQSLALMW